MGVQIGELDRRVILRRVTESIDVVGGVSQAYYDREIWASKSFRGGDGGNEYEEGGVVKKNNDTIFTIRFRTVNYRDKIIYRNEVYDIQRIEEVGRNDYLKLFCNTDD